MKPSASNIVSEDERTNAPLGIDRGDFEELMERISTLNDEQKANAIAILSGGKKIENPIPKGELKSEFSGASTENPSNQSKFKNRDAAKVSIEFLRSQRLGIIKENQYQEELEKACHCALTGLPDRKLFIQNLQKMLKAGEDRAIVFIDLDGFKSLNDACGHDAGDQALKEVSRRLKVKYPDLGRFGGDEFVLSISSDVEIDDLRRDIRETISGISYTALDKDGVLQFYPIGASIGAAYTRDILKENLDFRQQVDMLIKLSDHIMYADKWGGDGKKIGEGTQAENPDAPKFRRLEELVQDAKHEYYASHDLGSGPT